MAAIPSDGQWQTLFHYILTGNCDQLRAVLEREDPWLEYHGGKHGTVRTAWDSAAKNRLAVLELLVGHGWNVTGELFDDEAEQVVQKQLESGPRWRLEAREQGILRVCIVGEKAWGLAFIPGDAQTPIRYGGGYEGEWPFKSRDALSQLDVDLSGARPSQLAERAHWFRTFLVKMSSGRSFRLEDVLKKVEKPYQISRIERAKSST